MRGRSVGPQKTERRDVSFKQSSRATLQAMADLARGSRPANDVDAVANLVSKVEAAATKDGDIASGLKALADFSEEPEQLRPPAKISPQLAWMPFSYNEALSNLALTR